MSNNEFKVPELPTKVKSPIPTKANISISSKESSEEVIPNGAQGYYLIISISNNYN